MLFPPSDLALEETCVDLQLKNSPTCTNPVLPRPHERVLTRGYVIFFLSKMLGLGVPICNLKGLSY